LGRAGAGDFYQSADIGGIYGGLHGGVGVTENRAAINRGKTDCASARATSGRQ
jgi:hypothetical protein